MLAVDVQQGARSNYIVVNRLSNFHQIFAFIIMSLNMDNNPNRVLANAYAKKTLAGEPRPKEKKSDESGFLMLVGLALGVAVPLAIKYLQDL